MSSPQDIFLAKTIHRQHTEATDITKLKHIQAGPSAPHPTRHLSAQRFVIGAARCSYIILTLPAGPCLWLFLRILWHFRRPLRAARCFRTDPAWGEAYHLSGDKVERACSGLSSSGSSGRWKRLPSTASRGPRSNRRSGERRKPPCSERRVRTHGVAADDAARSAADGGVRLGGRAPDGGRAGDRLRAGVKPRSEPR